MPPGLSQSTDLFDVALPHLQHGQVVVGLGVAVVVGQSQPQALMGQIRVSYPLQRKSMLAHTQTPALPPASPPIFLRINLFCARGNSNKYQSQESSVNRTEEGLTWDYKMSDGDS